MIKLAPFRASDHLDSEEMIVEYLTAAAEDENPDVLLAAISEVARARGMTRVAADAGIGRESLYKSLAARILASRRSTQSCTPSASGCRSKFGRKRLQALNLACAAERNRKPA